MIGEIKVFFDRSYLLRAVNEDLDLSNHWVDAVNILKIGIAEVESYKKEMQIHFNRKN